MNILYLHQYFNTPECNGGTRSYEMAKRLIKSGHQVTFVTSSAFLDGVYEFHSGWNYIIIEGIKLHVLQLPYSNKDPYISRIIKFISFALRSSLKAVKIECDVIFATSTPLTIIIPAYIASCFQKRPIVFEVRDLWPELPIAVGAIKNPFLIKATLFLEKFAYNKSRKIIALSQGMADVIKTYHSNNEVVVIPNSCDTDLFKIDKARGIEYKHRRFSFVNERKLVVYTGTFGIINDVSYLVHLAYYSKKQGYNICFCAIGDGAERKKILNLAKDKGVLNDNFFLLDPVPKNEIVLVLSAADLALSLFGPVKEMWHNSANKMFDALASGTPIGINYKGWQYDLLQREAFGLYLNCENLEIAATHLDEFLKDEFRYTKAQAVCTKLAFGDFSRDELYRKFEAVLKEACKDG